MSLTSLMMADLPGIQHAFGTVDDELPRAPYVLMKQVHGKHCEVITQVKNQEISSCDAIVTQEKNLALVVKTADCEPILLCDPQGKNGPVIGAVHAGWRGSVQRVVQKTIVKMVELGAHVSQIHASLGPCLQQDCFEVGDDVVQAFQKEFPEWNFISTSIHGRPDKYQLNLHRYNREQLVEAGVRFIDEMNHCTYCHPELFYSYRRGDKEGRLYHHIRIL